MCCFQFVWLMRSVIAAVGVPCGREWQWSGFAHNDLFSRLVLLEECIYAEVWVEIFHLHPFQFLQSSAEDYNSAGRPRSLSTRPIVLSQQAEVGFVVAWVTQRGSFANGTAPAPLSLPPAPAPPLLQLPQPPSVQWLVPGDAEPGEAPALETSGLPGDGGCLDFWDGSW